LTFDKAELFSQLLAIEVAGEFGFEMTSGLAIEWLEILEIDCTGEFPALPIPVAFIVATCGYWYCSMFNVDDCKIKNYENLLNKLFGNLSAHVVLASVWGWEPIRIQFI
jgi:hypothetical protein